MNSIIIGRYKIILIMFSRYQLNGKISPISMHHRCSLIKPHTSGETLTVIMLMWFLIVKYIFCVPLYSGHH